MEEIKDDINSSGYYTLAADPPSPQNGNTLRTPAPAPRSAVLSSSSSFTRGGSASPPSQRSPVLHPAFSAALPASASLLPLSASARAFKDFAAPPSSSSIVIAECSALLATASASDVYAAAAVYVHDALTLRAIHHGLSGRALRMYMFRQRWSWYLLMRALCIAQLCLVLIEPPSSFSFGISAQASAGIELVILLIFCFDTYLSFIALTRAGFVRSRFRQLKVVMLTVCIVDSLWSLAVPGRAFRLATLLRCFFLTERSGRLRRVLKSLLRAAPVIGNVLFLLAIHVLSFGFLGWMLFARLEREDPSRLGCRSRDEHALSQTEKCYFQNLNVAFMSLFILLTNANFPDIMMPAYRANRLSFLFFLCFLLIGLYLLMQLVLAVIFHTFKNHTVRDVKYYAQRADRAFRAAFYLLGSVEARKDAIHLNSCLHVMREMRPDMSEQQAKIVFRAVKETSSGSDWSEREAAGKGMRAVDGEHRSSVSSSSRRRSSVAATASTAAEAARVEDEEKSIDYRHFKDFCSLIHVRFRPMEDPQQQRLYSNNRTPDLASPSALPYHAASHSTIATPGSAASDSFVLEEKTPAAAGQTQQSAAEVEENDDINASRSAVNETVLLLPSAVAPASSAAPPLGDTSILEEVDASDDEGDDEQVEGRGEEETLPLQTLPLPSFFHPLFTFISRHAAGILSVRTVDVVVDVLSALSAIIIVVQAELVHIEGEGKTESEADADTVTFLTVVQSIIFSVFLVEMAVKLLLMRSSYFLSSFRCVDLFLLFVSTLGQILWYANTMVIPSFYLRPMRLLRLGRVLRRLKAILNTLTVMLPALTPLLVLQTLVFYVFAILGMAFFAGSITPLTVPRDSPLEYAANDYYANTFDDVLRSYVTLFELLIGNNWYYVMDAAVYVTSDYSMLFFIAFYSVAVLIVMNVLTAFILEAFLMQQQREEMAKDAAKSRKQRSQDRKDAARRLQDELQDADPASAAAAAAKLEEEEEKEEERAVKEKAEAAMLPRCFPKLRELAARDLKQQVELKQPTGMAAVLHRMYRMSVSEE